MNTALAYVNWGRWVVDCPQPGCADAREVRPPQMEDVCASGHPFTIVMPTNAATITAELGTRARERDRNWYPAGHERAEVAGQPTGQTVTQLRTESGEIKGYLTRQQQSRQTLADALADYGVSINPDGRFKGSL
jgi:hypothetical protein